MAQWLVMQGDTKFPVSGLAELEALARRGALRSGDMIQPPGTSDWMYATEVPELKVLIERSADDDDDGPRSSMLGGAAIAAIAGVAALVLGFAAIAGGGTMLYLASRIDESKGGLIGEGGLTYSQMIVTSAGSGLRDDANDSARITTSVAKDSVLELLAKRGDFYRARTNTGAEGWIPATHVIPMYQLGDASVRDEYDPLYNPDRYVEVLNSRWMQLPAERPGMDVGNVTIFEFMMSNDSRYPMTDLRILATIKDAQGHELERIEIPVEGVIPADGTSFVGTFSSETETERSKRGKRKADPDAEPDRIMTTWSFDEMAKDDPELQLRFTSGVELEMKTDTFANAQIDIVELRAVPDKDAAAIVRR